MMNNNANSATL